MLKAAQRRKKRKNSVDTGRKNESPCLFTFELLGYHGLFGSFGIREIFYFFQVSSITNCH